MEKEWENHLQMGDVNNCHGLITGRVSSRVSSIATFDYQSITKGVNDSMDFRGNRHRFQSVPWFSDVPLNQFGGTGPTSFTNQKAGGWTRWIRETDGKCQTYQQ